MTKYRIDTYKDKSRSPGDDKQWVAEVIETSSPGTEGEDVNCIYATTWYGTEDEAEGDAGNWLWVNKRKWAPRRRCS